MWILTSGQREFNYFKTFFRLGKSVYGRTDKGKVFRLKKTKTVGEAKELMVKIMINSDQYSNITMDELCKTK